MTNEYLELLERMKALHQKEHRLEVQIHRVKAEILACEMQLRVFHLECDGEYK